MRYYSDGNLAEQLARQPVPELPDINVPRRDEIDPEHGKREKYLVENNEIRLQYKRHGRWRLKVSLRLLSILLVLSTAIGFIVWRGAKLTEMSFYNAGLKRQINELDKENSLLQDKILNKSSLYAVKDVATSELGLQKPGSDQIVYVPAAILNPAIEDDDADTASLNGTNRSPAESMKLIESWVRGR